MRSKPSSIIDLLVIVAVIGVLASILFPVFAQAEKSQRKTSEFNLRKISRAAIHYGQDCDGLLPIVINGRFRDLKNVADGQLTAYGAQRSDQWPLILLPYLKDRTTYVDVERGDSFGIWKGAPLATSDSGYDPYANSYRNQSRYPMYGVNYLFLSPMVVPASKLSDASPTDYMVGVAHAFDEADDPSHTVFYTESQRAYVPTTTTDTIGTLDAARGFFGVNAPGVWNTLVQNWESTPIIFWTGANCSGDWCGGDVDPHQPGVQTRESFFYKAAGTSGNNTSFMDGHTAFRTAAQLASGTDYLTATPTDGGSGAFGGGSSITDKSQFLWNLDDNYYGAD